jgi:hypothetical protein
MDLFLFDYTSFDEGYQHLGLVSLREHIVWFCVGVKDGPAKGLGCEQALSMQILTYLCQ